MLPPTATSFAAGAIMLGLRDVVVAGGAWVPGASRGWGRGSPCLPLQCRMHTHAGTESMSRVPHYTNQLRFGCKFGHQEMVDGVIKVRFVPCLAALAVRA